MGKNTLLKQGKKLSLGHKINTFLEKNPRLRTPLGVAVPLFIMIVLLTIANPIFLSQRNIFNILRQTAIYMVLGTGVTLVIGNGGIDLSVGSMVGLTACIVGTILKSDISSVPLAIFIAILVGLFGGAFNGIAVSIFKVPPLITTLGTMTTLRGIAYLLM